MMNDNDLIGIKEKIANIYKSCDKDKVSVKDYMDAFANLANLCVTLQEREGIAPEQFGKLVNDVVYEMNVEKYLHPNAQFQEKRK